MNRKFLTVTLNPSLDKTVFIQKNLKQGGYQFQKEIISAGGKGINVSRALKGLGLQSIATGFLGGSAGEEILAGLKKEGIYGSFVAITGSTRTNYTLLEQDISRSQRFWGIDPEIKQRDVDLFWKQYKLFLCNVDVVIISGRCPAGLPDNFLGQLIKAANRQKLLTVLDTSCLALRVGIKAAPFFIKPNLDEAQEALNKRLNSMSALRSGLLKLHQMGARLTVITLGAKGSVGFDGNEMYVCRHPNIKIKNEVGCGDAFTAGFISSYSENNNFPESIRFGALCGISSALNLIPGQVDPKQFLKLKQQIRIKKFN